MLLMVHDHYSNLISASTITVYCVIILIKHCLISDMKKIIPY